MLAKNSLTSICRYLLEPPKHQWQLSNPAARASARELKYLLCSGLISLIWQFAFVLFRSCTSILFVFPRYIRRRQSAHYLTDDALVGEGVTRIRLQFPWLAQKHYRALSSSSKLEAESFIAEDYLNNCNCWALPPPMVIQALTHINFLLLSGIVD